MQRAARGALLAPLGARRCELAVADLLSSKGAHPERGNSSRGRENNRASLALRIVLVAYLLCMTLAHWSCSVIGLNGVIVWLKLLRSLTALHPHHGAAIGAPVCLAGGVTGPGSWRVLPPVLPLHR